MDFSWLMQMRFYCDPRNTSVLKQLSIQMANACFHHGFEYLGVQDKLMQTPLTDRYVIRCSKVVTYFGAIRRILNPFFSQKLIVRRITRIAVTPDVWIR